MAIENDLHAPTVSAARAAPVQIVKPSSYGPVKAIADMRTTLYTTPPKKDLAIRPFADGGVGGGNQLAQYYDIGSNDVDKEAELREKWRQVSHAWAARLMEGLGEKAQNFKIRLELQFIWLVPDAR